MKKNNQAPILPINLLESHKSFFLIYVISTKEKSSQVTLQKSAIFFTEFRV